MFRVDTKLNPDGSPSTATLDSGNAVINAGTGNVASEHRAVLVVLGNLFITIEEIEGLGTPSKNTTTTLSGAGIHPPAQTVVVVEG